MKNNSTINSYLFLFLLSFGFFYTANSFAQDEEIYEIVQDGHSKKESKNTNNRDDFYELLFNMHDTYYIANRRISRYGNGYPLKLTIEDVNFMGYVRRFRYRINKVELVSINLNDPSQLNSLLNTAVLRTGFENLKYIYIKCNFECSEKDLKKFIKPNSDVRVFYKYEKQS